VRTHRAEGEMRPLSSDSRSVSGAAAIDLRRRVRAALGVAAYVLVLVGCGGSGGGGLSSSGSSGPGPGSGGGLGVQAMWELPGGTGGSSSLPNAVKIVRVVFESSSGLRCCIAIDPTTVPSDPATGQRVLVLDQLPAGPGTFTLAGFVTDFAPAPDGITEVCPTSPSMIGDACDTTQPATPSFLSDATAVTIVAGTRAQTGNSEIRAFPFVFDLDPAPGDTVTSPAPITFKAANAAHALNPDSIGLELTEAAFRPLSKRLPVTLIPCDDSGDNTCSNGGELGVTGFRVSSPPQILPTGSARLRITASPQDAAAPDLDFSYGFTVGPQPTLPANGNNHALQH
jgi:hypothetical protein